MLQYTVRPVEQATFTEKFDAALWSLVPACMMAGAWALFFWYLHTSPPEQPPPPPKASTSRYPLIKPQPKPPAPLWQPPSRRLAFWSFVVASAICAPPVAYFAYLPLLRFGMRSRAKADAKAKADADAKAKRDRERAEKAQQDAYMKAEAERRAAAEKAHAQLVEANKWRLAAAATLNSAPDTPSFFAAFATATPGQRDLMAGGYEQRLAAATTRDKDHRDSLGRLNGLSDEANILFLSAIIDAGNVPLDLAASDMTNNRLVYVGTDGVPDLAHWQKSIPAINAILGGKWRVERGRGTAIILTALPKVPQAYPLTPAMLAKGQLFFGIDLTTGKPFNLPVRDLTHTIVQGAQGSGKSTFMHLLMANVLANLDEFEAIYMVDMKGGVEAHRYAITSPKITVIDDRDGLLPLLDKLEALMAQRQPLMRARGITDWDGPRTLVIVDEFSEVFLGADKKADAEHLKRQFYRLAARSRASGIRLWVQVQNASADTVPTDIRTNLTSKIAFKQNAAQATAIFGRVEDTMPVPIAELAKGQIIFEHGDDGSKRYALQAPMITFDDVKRLVGARA